MLRGRPPRSLCFLIPLKKKQGKAFVSRRGSSFDELASRIVPTEAEWKGSDLLVSLFTPGFPGRVDLTLPIL